MKFNWTPRTIQQWRQSLYLCSQASWMQTWPYAQAVWKRDFLQTHLATIYSGPTELGFMALQRLDLGPFHVVNLSRGPIWKDDFYNEELWIDFAYLLCKELPSWGVRLRWILERPISAPVLQKLLNSGYKLRPENFQTVIWDITADPQILKSRLKSKWRNCLSKAERHIEKIEIDENLNYQNKFLLNYEWYKKNKKFHGPSPLFFKIEWSEAVYSKDVILVIAWIDNSPIAGMAFLLHGHSASYRAGWSSQQGRIHNAHYLILWKAALYLRNKGVRKIDLGGILPAEAPGVTHFKTGLGGIHQYHHVLSF